MKVAVAILVQVESIGRKTFPSSSPLDVEGWQKLKKVAHWRSSELHGVRLGSLKMAMEMAKLGESPFFVLSDLVMDEDMGQAMGPALFDLPIVDLGLGQAHLKQARSPGPKQGGD